MILYAEKFRNLIVQKLKLLNCYVLTVLPALYIAFFKRYF